MREGHTARDTPKILFIYTYNLQTDMKKTTEENNEVYNLLGKKKKDTTKKINLEIYTPHKNQQKIIDSDARFKVINCGRRFGKTTFAVNTLFISALLQDNGTFWYVAPTYRQAKQIAWRMFTELYYLNNKKLFSKPPNESQLQLILENGSYIELKGADNEDSLRGVGLDGVVLDEYATMKPHVWDEIIQPTITDKQGWGMFISTPQGYNHFHEMYEKAKFLPDWERFHFTSYDNPALKKGEIDRAKTETAEDYFAQEYMADFRKFTGLVYKEFDRKTHVSNSFEIPNDWSRWRTIDAGYNNPFCCLWVTQDPESGIFYIYDEHYLPLQTTRYHAEIINGKSVGQYFKATYIDPSASQVMQDLGTFGVYCYKADNTVVYKRGQDYESGIPKVAELLKIDPILNKPKIMIFKDCKNFIDEIETYRWEQNKIDKNARETPHKSNDHAMDALRYFVNSYNLILNPKPYKKSTPVYQPRNLITGY